MKLLICLLLISNLCHADPHEDAVHFAAHAGTSFAVDTIAYGVNNRLGLSKPHSRELAVFETLTIGLLYKLSERAGKLDTPMMENTIGAGAATLTIWTFE